MIGRMVGVIVGAIIAVTGYGMLKPAVFVRYVDFSRIGLGPFGEYRTLVCWMIVAIGAAVAIASVQRRIEGQAARSRKGRPASVVFTPEAPEPEPVAAHPPMNFDFEPEPEAHAPAAEAEAEPDHEPETAPSSSRRSSPSARTPTPLW